MAFFHDSLTLFRCKFFFCFNRKFFSIIYDLFNIFYWTDRPFIKIGAIVLCMFLCRKTNITKKCFFTFFIFILPKHSSDKVPSMPVFQQNRFLRLITRSLFDEKTEKKINTHCCKIITFFILLKIQKYFKSTWNTFWYYAYFIRNTIF